MPKSVDVSKNRHRPWCEVRTNDDGSLDEIVAEGVDIHLEQMNDGCWWLGIYKNNNTERQVLWLNSKKPITANTEAD